MWPPSPFVKAQMRPPAENAADPAPAPPPPPRVSLIIPAFNEARRLPENLRRVAAYRDTLPPAADDGAAGCEVLVIVEQSTDDTLARCREVAAELLGFQVLDNGPRRGKGHAVRAGMRRARGDLQFFMDADLSTPLDEIARFLRFFAEHPETDVLIGDRREAQRRREHRQGPWRRALGAVFRAATRWQGAGVLPPGVVDTQCGFKAFRRDAAREVFARQRLDGFVFDVEILLLAARLGFGITDLPVRWADHPASTLSVARDGWRMLRDLARVRPLVERTLREQPPLGLTPPAVHPAPALAAGSGLRNR